MFTFRQFSHTRHNDTYSCTFRWVIVM